MDGIVGIAGIVLGVVIGGLISEYHNAKQRQYEFQREKRNRLIAKYEELFKLLSQGLQSCTQINIQIVGKGSTKSKIEAEQIKTKIPTKELEMLVAFYVPELEGDLGCFKKQATTLNQILVECMLELPKGEQQRLEASVNSNELMKVIRKTIESMHSKLIQAAKAVQADA